MSLITALVIVGIAGGAAQDTVSAAGQDTASVSALDATAPALGDNPATTARSEQESAPPSTRQEEPRGFYFDDGVWLRLLRGRLRVRFGAEVQLDGVAYPNPPTAEDFRADLAFRRARLDIVGELGERWRFRLRADAVADDPPTWKDAYIEFRLLRIDSFIRSGRFSSRFGLEKGSSPNDFVFMEQSLPNVLVPPQETGVLFHRQGPEGNWDIGITSATSDLSSCLACDVQGLVARFSHGFELAQGAQVLHVGINLAGRRPGDGLARYRSRPESFLSPFLVDTGFMPADRVTVFLVEGAYRNGPFLIQGEFGGSRVSLSGTDETPFFNGFYVFAAYMLTGEQRAYRFGSGSFRRPRPNRPLLGRGDGGLGAVELAARFSQLDLSDKGVEGGRLRDLTLGLNWYPGDRVRLAVNAIRANRKGFEHFWILQARLQLGL